MWSQKRFHGVVQTVSEVGGGWCIRERGGEWERKWMRR